MNNCWLALNNKWEWCDWLRITKCEWHWETYLISFPLLNDNIVEGDCIANSHQAEQQQTDRHAHLKQIKDKNWTRVDEITSSAPVNTMTVVHLNSKTFRKEWRIFAENHALNKIRALRGYLYATLADLQALSAEWWLKKSFWSEWITESKWNCHFLNNSQKIVLVYFQMENKRFDIQKWKPRKTIPIAELEKSYQKLLKINPWPKL